MGNVDINELTSGYKIGLLVNFTHPKAEIKRFIL